MIITQDIPGGNIQVFHVDGNHIYLDNVLRGTIQNWFYWSFKAVFDKPGTYHFHFKSPDRISARGPAVSLDNGLTWSWLDNNDDNQNFSYTCPVANQDVLFCMGMQYLQTDWERFVQPFASQCHRFSLCRSRHGQNVEMLEIREGSPQFGLLLTARHHAGEMMANHVMEGLLREIMADTEIGRTFRRNIAVYAVPFVDKDGVEEGDQGKRRPPHDFCLDYVPDSLYPETTAIRHWLDIVKPDFVLDLHCPWLRWGANETSYMVGCGKEDMDREMDRFADCMELERVTEAPYYKADNMPFGQDWNTPENTAEGATLNEYAGPLPYIFNAQLLEIPFANFRDVTIDRAAAMKYGASIARAILRYFQMVSIEGKTFQK